MAEQKNAEESEIELVSAALLQKTVTELGERLRTWWKVEGLGYASDLAMTAGGSFDVTFSCSLNSISEILDMPGLSEASEKEQMEFAYKHFAAKGYAMHWESSEELAVIDCEQSQKVLTELLSATFPSMIMRSTTSRGTRSGQLVLQSIRVLIRDLSPLYAMAPSSR